MLKKYLLLTLSALSVLLAGCASQTAPVTGDTGETTASEQQTAAVNEHFLDEIRDRGYLIAGCKMDVPDLSYYDEETDTWSGLEVDLAYEIAAAIFDVTPEDAKANHLAVFAGVTVADREEKLEEGAIDCMLATYSITEARAERFALSDSYYTDYIGLLVKDSGENINSLGSTDITSIADLDGKYIGVPRNATTREDFLAYIDTMNTIRVTPIFCEYASYDALFQALKDGRIDAMSVDVSILRGYQDSSTRILDVRFGSQHYGVAAKKENAAIIDIANTIIASHSSGSVVN